MFDKKRKLLMIEPNINLAQLQEILYSIEEWKNLGNCRETSSDFIIYLLFFSPAVPA